MRRFDENATLDRVAERGELSPQLIRRLAAAIRRSHDRAPLSDGERATRSLATYLDQNQAAFAARPDLFAPPRAAALDRESRAAFAALRPLLIARGARAGCGAATATCTLRNIALIDGEPTLFDAIEFDPDIATGDVLYDLAFTLMDLWERELARRGQPAAGELSGARPAKRARRARRPALVHEPARRDPRQGRGGERRPSRRRRARRRARAGAPLFRPRRGVPAPCAAAPSRRRRPFGSRQERARRRARAEDRPGARARWCCAATSSASACSASPRPSACPTRTTIRRPRAPSMRASSRKARRALAAGHGVILDAVHAQVGRARDGGRARRGTRRPLRRPLARDAAHDAPRPSRGAARRRVRRRPPGRYATAGRAARGSRLAPPRRERRPGLDCSRGARALRRLAAASQGFGRAVSWRRRDDLV